MVCMYVYIYIYIYTYTAHVYILLYFFLYTSIQYTSSLILVAKKNVQMLLERLEKTRYYQMTTIVYSAQNFMYVRVWVGVSVGGHYYKLVPKDH